MLPVVSKDIFGAYSASNISPGDVIKDIDSKNPILSLALARYIKLCDEDMRSHVITGMALVYGLLNFQSEADDLNKQWEN